MKKPTSSIMSYLKRFPLLVAIRQQIRQIGSYFNKYTDGTHGVSLVNVVQSYPLFTPSSAGSYKQKTALTTASINSVIPLLSGLSKTYHQELPKITLQQLTNDSVDSEEATQLRELFDHHGSDKGGNHEYYKLYSFVIEKIGKVDAVLEIGLGTNNTDVVSNMSRRGRPGASLRAFRDRLRDASIYGADVDERILFQDERIQTFYVDQTDLDSLYALKSHLPKELDIIIDDGLHAPNANIATLLTLLDKLKVGGYFIIEDIPSTAIPVWDVVAALLPDSFQSKLVKAKKAWVFLVARKGS